MINPKLAEQAIQNLNLPVNTEAILKLAHLISFAANTNPTSSDISSITDISNDISALLEMLAGRKVVVQEKLIAFGEGNRFGNITIGDIAGNNVYKVNLTFQAAPPSDHKHNVFKALFQLREPVADFVGRENEIIIAENYIATAQTSKVIIIRGMGGVGKTELAYRIGRHFSRYFTDAQLVVELQGSSVKQQVHVEQALQSLIQSFDREMKLPDDISALNKIYRTLLTSKQAIILADDVAGAKQVQALVPPEGSLLIITSRQRFSVPGMLAIDLEPLPIKTASVLTKFICPRIKGHAHRIAELCGGLPLAIRVSAGILDNDPSKDINSYVELLTNERDRLRALRDPDDPELDVEASLNLSYDTLSSHDRDVFCQCGIFPASFNKEAAYNVINPPPHDTISIHDHLSILVRHNLVIWNSSTKRYFLHDLIRSFAVSRLANQEEILARFAKHFLSLAESIEKMYRDGGHPMLNALRIFDTERANFEVSVHWLRKTKSLARPSGGLAKFHNSLMPMWATRYDRNIALIPLL